MIRYLKIGGLAFAILAVGFVLGSGSIGDLINAWVSGTGAQADQAAVEENRQQLADRDVETFGEALGSESPRMGYDLAVRCVALTRLIPVESAEREGVSRDALLTIRANGRTVAINQSEDGAFQVTGDVARQMPPYGDDARQRPETPEQIIELKNACSPLLGRQATQQNDQ